MYLDEAVEHFNVYYGNDTDCLALVESLRWPNGFQCPSCNSGQAYRIQTRKLPLFQCKPCGHQTSLTAGTVMHRSKTPIRKWLLTMFLMAASANSVNAVKLSNILGVTYKTAWSMLHHIRIAISETDGRQKLKGHVEAKHELFLGDFWMIESRMFREKSAIIAREVGSNHSSRYKMKLIADKPKARDPLTEQHSLDFLEQYCSSELRSYAMNPRHQFSRYKTVFEQEKNINRTKLITFYASPEEYAARRQISALEISCSLSEIAMDVYSWLSGTFNGISPKYAQFYFDEFCFRLSHGSLKESERFEKIIELGLSNRQSRNSVSILPSYSLASAI